jgi:hypothetical protein
MKDNFFPTSDYQIPQTSNYMKFTDGNNKFRVLSSAIVGYEYWNTDNKPVRNRITWNTVPDDIKTDKDGGIKISHFWAFVVYNYDAKKIQILELTQKGIMKYIKGLTEDVDWGNPSGYDIVVNRSGSGFDTEYTTTAKPHSPLDPAILEQYAQMNINLEALYDGKDPFASK